MFGKPHAITRSHANGSVALTRSYAYDVHQRLCRTAEPETGVTLTGYDANSNVAWTAAGLPSSTTCAHSESAAVVARRISRHYDARNRVTHLRHPDGRGDQDWTYTENGLPNQVVTYNGFWQSEAVINVYAYNSLGKLGGQGDSVRQDGWYTWAIGYGYDCNGSQSVIIQPMARH